jgi:ubiquitin-like-conjugating enzyme ATG10
MLSDFPHLTTAEHAEACNYLAAMFRKQGDKQTAWHSVEILQSRDTNYLRITKQLCTDDHSRESSKHEAEQDELEEDDDEVMQPARAPPALVLYDILLSPVYRVPVLYISISDSQHRYPPTMSTLYEHLISPHFKAQTEHSGVIGGVSIIVSCTLGLYQLATKCPQDHPISNSPVFFIHPCQTPEVMEATVGRRDINAPEYLLIWIGAMGKCVGLDIPLPLMQHDRSASPLVLEF